LLWLIPSCYSSCGFLSLELFLAGQQCLHASQVRDLSPSVWLIWANYVALFFELWILIPRNILFGLTTSNSGPAVLHSQFRSSAPLLQPTMGFSPQILYNSGPAAPSLNSGVTSSSPKSGFMLTLTLDTRILVAIYQFGCRMSNMNVSPQLAILDGPVFVSSALCREKPTV
jgi:hypothetical protein